MKVEGLAAVLAHGHAHMRQPVEMRDRACPIMTVQPVRLQPLQVIAVGPVLPAGVRRLFKPAIGCDPVANPRNFGLVHRNGEGGGTHAASPSLRSSFTRLAMMSAAFSAIMMVGALVLPDTR